MGSNIKVLKPQVFQAEAVELLKKSSSLFPFFRYHHKQLTNFELVYLPFYLVIFNVQTKDREAPLVISIDGLLGQMAIFELSGYDIVPIDNQPYCEFQISEDEALESSYRFCRGLILERSLWVKKTAEVEQTMDIQSIFYPFWIGYFKKKDRFDFRALDAMTGTLTDIQMRRLFLKAIRQFSHK